jgi:nitronate monooxygenase
MTLAWLDALRFPILNASMAGAAGGRLAGAVSRAGGLGTIGFGTAATPESVAAECARAEGAPFGVGLMVWVVRERPELLTAVLAERPEVLSLSFGDPAGLVPIAQEAGASVCSQVGTLAEAEQALAAGVDFLVARGSEGGGHGRGEVATLPLLQQVLAMSPVPVLAAGGIGTARGVAAVLAAGAVGAWVGTPFVACEESDASAAVKRAVVQADSADTVYTRAFDIAQGVPWPKHYGGRALANPFSDVWADRIRDLEALAETDDSLTATMIDARRHDDLSMAPVYAGQSVGLVPRIRTAAEVVGDLSGYAEHLRSAVGRFGQAE